MIETTVKIGGMMCGMCESHINDAIRNAFAVKKVSSSRSKSEAVILSEEGLDEDKLKTVITAMGYDVMLISSSPYEKKGLFGHKKK